jgi:hypothetical protein
MSSYIELRHYYSQNAILCMLNTYSRFIPKGVADTRKMLYRYNLNDTTYIFKKTALMSVV